MVMDNISRVTSIFGCFLLYQIHVKMNVSRSDGMVRNHFFVRLAFSVWLTFSDYITLVSFLLYDPSVSIRITSVHHGSSNDLRVFERSILL